MVIALADMSDGIGATTIKVCPNERRRARRYALDWPIRVVGKDSNAVPFEEVARLRNLCSNGAYTYLEHWPHVGSKLTISIKLPFKRGTWMRYSATVIRVESEAASIGVALKFDTSKPVFDQDQDHL